MIKLNQPKFKFLFYINSKNKYNDKQNNIDKKICYADSYEITSDGSITFYQIATFLEGDKNKLIKVPVLSYPAGKWENCSLIDDFDQLVAFNFKSSSITQPNVQKSYERPSTSPLTVPIMDTLDSKEPESVKQTQSQNVFDELESFSSDKPSLQQNNYNPGFSNTENNNTLGINEHNPEEYKKRKNDFLETRIKEYMKYEDNFIINKFLPGIQNEARIKDIGNITETDVIWAASNLIRAKAVIARKFSNENIQKTLEFTLPDIMKRQWNGKMSPILQVLQDREETKNANAIDLSVWMVKHKFIE